jgi:hypothetical protein
LGISTVRTTSYWPVVTYALTSRPPNLAITALLAAAGVAQAAGTAV